MISSNDHKYEEQDCLPILSLETRLSILEEKFKYLIEKSEFSTQKDIFKQINKFITNLIFFIYEKIVRIIAKNYKEDLKTLNLNFYSWETLMLLSEGNNILGTFITQTLNSLKITNDEWQEITNFKLRRHYEKYENIDYVIQIINEFPDKSNIPLMKILTKIIYQFKN